MANLCAIDLHLIFRQNWPSDTTKVITFESFGAKIFQLGYGDKATITLKPHCMRCQQDQLKEPGKNT